MSICPMSHNTSALLYCRGARVDIILSLALACLLLCGLCYGEQTVQIAPTLHNKARRAEVCNRYTMLQAIQLYIALQSLRCAFGHGLQTYSSAGDGSDFLCDDRQHWAAQWHGGA
jgi:hypothetical protein